MENLNKANSSNNQQPRPAPLWTRLIAMLYDSFLVLAISMGYGAVMTAITAHQSANQAKDYEPTVEGLGFQLGWIAIIFAFYCFFWLRAGQTVGMKAWRLKIVSNTGRSLTLWQCMIRFLAACFSLGLGGLGFWWALIDKKKETLHDKISKSSVMCYPKQAKKNTKDIKN